MACRSVRVFFVVAWLAALQQMAPVCSASDQELPAETPKPPDSAAAADALMRGKRLVVLGNFFLGDFDSKRKFHHEAVEGQLCEFASRQGVTIDFLLFDKARSKPDRVYKLCAGQSVMCDRNAEATSVFSCYETLLKLLPEGTQHAAVASRDDERMEATQLLAERLGLPSPFAKGHEIRHDTFALSFAEHFNKGGTYPLGGDCRVPSESEVPDAAFPLFVKFAQGLHSTGGWGGLCVREMQHVRDRGELARKMPFFCGEGMRSYWFLKKPAQREMYLTRALFGIEIMVEVAVYRGKPSLVDFRAGMMACDGKVASTFPMHAPGWNDAAHARCKALVEHVVEKAGLYNAVVGIQLFYDWRDPEAGCSLIELNPRPHDWAIAADHSWNIRRGSDDYFDYGAAMLYLAFDLDPAPLRLSVPAAYSSAVALVCPMDNTGSGGVFNYKQFMSLATNAAACEVSIAPTPAKAVDGLPAGEWPCLDGPTHLPLGLDLERLCMQEIKSKMSFWWINTKLLRKDVHEVCRPLDAPKHLGEL